MLNPPAHPTSARRRSYLDHNATTPLKPSAQARMLELLSLTGNPSSVHGEGRAVRRCIDTARHDVAQLVGTTSERVLFTSGATEANALALYGFAGQKIAVSAIEHPSILANAPNALILPVLPSGIIDLAAAESLLYNHRPAALAVMLVNNETGVIQPVAEIANIARSLGIFIHCDAVQAAGRISLSMTDLGVHSLSLSGHKIGGGTGAGALILADGVDIPPMLKGGGQERNRRAGTENALAIAGFGAACVAAQADMAAFQALASLRDGLEEKLAQDFPECLIFGQTAPRVSNTTTLALPGAKAENLVIALDMAGIAVSAGSACSSGKVRASTVLTAMGVPENLAGAAIRISLGWNSTAADITHFLDVWHKIAHKKPT